eukprot:maker-scaffold_12-snap-gene-11.22-mRNA-1 protein AED:0.27 eAED:0.30 QI:0/0/0/1/0.5/0.2/5/0/868
MSSAPASENGIRLENISGNFIISKVDAVPLFVIKDNYTKHVDNLGPDEPIPPILISNMADNMPEKFDEVGIGEGNISKKEELESLKNMIATKVSASTLTDEQKGAMIQVISGHMSSWGIKQSNAQMSLMSPIEVSLVEGYRILRSHGYHLTVDEENFLDLKFKALESAGIVERSTNPTWGHPLFVVEKKLENPPDWYQYSNEAKVKWKRDNILNRVFDFLPTAEKDRDIFTLITRRSAWRMKGAPMGWSNTPPLFFERSFEELLVIFEKLLKQAARKRVRFNLRKCGICFPTTVWCGREIRKGRWNFDLAFYEKILNMKKPVYCHQMAQLVYLANWISPNIPKLAELRRPFQDFAKLKEKKLTEIEKLKEVIHWTPELEIAYKKLLEGILDASKRFLSTYDHTSPLILFTDSSKDTWSIAVFQDSPENVTNDVRTLKPRPLIFLSGEFTPSETRWHISSKELCPLIYSFQRIGFLLRTHIGGIYVYTDHKALISVVRSADLVIFHISSRDNFVSDLLTRWATDDAEDIYKIARCSWEVRLDEENFKDKGGLPVITDSIGGSCFDADPVLVHNKDVFGVDFLNQDDAPEYERSLIGITFCARVNTTRNSLNPRSVSVHSNYSDVKDFLFTEHISYLSPFCPKEDKQDELDEEFLSECDLVEGLFYFQAKLLVPRTLLTHFLVKNHIDKCHPSLSFKKKFLSNIYFHGIPKKDLLNLLHSYRQRCLHCQREPHLLRRPYNFTNLAKRAQDILRADYLHINKKGYILVLMESCTRKIMLFYSTSSIADTMTNTLLQWQTDLGFNDCFLVITDHCSHFANRLLETLSKKIGFEQFFPVAYSPWINGSIETINSSILRCLRSLVSQYRLHEPE